MPKIVMQKPIIYIARSWVMLLGASLYTAIARLMRGPLVKSWSSDFETANVFWRWQFRYALTRGDMAAGRRYFDSLQTYSNDNLATEECREPCGVWMTPPKVLGDSVVLHFHGGGYAFNAAVSKHFGRMLAVMLGRRLFYADYRLIPEHPHPAQIEDALAAYRYVLEQGIPPHQIVVTGDSAGGHLALMLLAALRKKELPQPALAIAISPWTDTGVRGESLYGNDQYDLVQGYMTQCFGKWLVKNTPYSHENVSPMYQDFKGVCPIYIQAGGREILVDMIRDFAAKLHAENQAVMLDVWPDMTHEFQAYGSDLTDSMDALMRMKKLIEENEGERGVGLKALDKQKYTELYHHVP